MLRTTDPAAPFSPVGAEVAAQPPTNTFEDASGGTGPVIYKLHVRQANE